MTSRLWLILVGLMVIAAPLRSLPAEERYLDFVQGLRDRNYFDYAMLYLDQVAQRPSLPEEIRQLIPYEKAITLRENAKVLRNPEKQFEQLDQALAYLEQFSRDYPDNPSSGDANSDRAQILLQKAEVEIFQSKSPSNKGVKVDLQRRGREFVLKAREILKRAFEQHETAFKQFPAYLDEQKEPKRHAERAKIERSLILESLNLAKCIYQEAQTYDTTAREFKGLLNQAADEFEKVHQKYRSQLGGLHARAWQGKCFEEQGDLQKALGIYNELLDHPGDDPALQNLKSQTLLFKLICLHEREDDQLVVDLVEDWLKKNPGESRSSLGLGIQWEQARAFETLGNNRSLAKTDQERFWRQARTVAQQINRFPGEYKDASLALMQRVQVKLGGKERKPEDFEAAYGLGRQFFNSAQEIKKELDAGNQDQSPPEELARLKQNWIVELNEAARHLELAATLVNRRDNPKEVATSRLLQAYTNFYLRHNYEAAILGQFVARTTSDTEDSVAMDAAYLAMAAFVQAYNDNPADPSQKLDDMRLIVKAANLIAARWPESEKANEARMVLGRLYTAAKQPVEAANWFSQIPDTDPKFPEARLAAGQAYWVAYGTAARLPAEARPSPEKLTEWKTVSEKYLQSGIQKLSATLPEDGDMPQELVSAKIYLAEILLSQGKEAEAAKLLIDDPQSIVKAIAVPDERQRPEKGVQSRSVAKSVYTLLLRAEIGMGLDKLNEARATMKTLESIAAGDAGSDLTDLYVGLGRMLKAELERFRNNGETERFKKLMAAFESFLGDMFKKQEGQTFGSLSWIGETYFALGEISTDRSKTASYYNRAAAAFNGILTRAQAEPNFATAEQLLNVKVRLVHCNRLKQDFPEAELLLTEVLKARGNDLRAQIEGASLYQDWGSSGDLKKFIVAISGRKDIGLWGWGGIAKRIQQQKNYAERPELVETFLDARYSVSLCRFLYGQDLPPQEKRKVMDVCAMELIGSASIMKTLPEEKRAKLNALYRDVLKESGKSVTDLPRSEEVPRDDARSTEEQGHEASPARTAENMEPTGTRPAEPAPRAASIDTTTWIVFLACLIAGAGVIGWVLLTGGKSRSKPKAKSFKRPLPDVAFTGIAVEKPQPPVFTLPTSTATTPSKPTPTAKPQTSTAASTTATARPRPKSTETPVVPGTGTPTSGASPAVPRPAKRTDAGAGPPPKPRPRPPVPPVEE